MWYTVAELIPRATIRQLNWWEASDPLRNAGADLMTRSRVSRARFRPRGKSWYRGRPRLIGRSSVLASIRTLAKTRA